MELWPSIVMVYTVVARVVIALYSCGLCSHGLYRYGLCSHGLELHMDSIAARQGIGRQALA